MICEHAIFPRHLYHLFSFTMLIDASIE
jgi:hypothetical protein